jgi:hypothetical protein
MRRRYAVILFLFLLGVVVALGQVGLLSLPFDVVVSLKIVMPEPLRASIERRPISFKIQFGREHRWQRSAKDHGRQFGGSRDKVEPRGRTQYCAYISQWRVGLCR